MRGLVASPFVVVVGGSLIVTAQGDTLLPVQNRLWLHIGIVYVVIGGAGLLLVARPSLLERGFRLSIASAAVGMTIVVLDEVELLRFGLPSFSDLFAVTILVPYAAALCFPLAFANPRQRKWTGVVLLVPFAIAVFYTFVLGIQFKWLMPVLYGSCLLGGILLGSIPYVLGRTVRGKSLLPYRDERSAV